MGNTDFKPQDARVGKPKHNGPVLCYLDDGTQCVAQWVERIGMWYDAQTKCTFGNVLDWYDYPLRPGYILSSIYDEVNDL